MIMGLGGVAIDTFKFVSSRNMDWVAMKLLWVRWLDFLIAISNSGAAESLDSTIKPCHCCATNASGGWRIPFCTGLSSPILLNKMLLKVT